jgi:hypothetical protein
VPQGLRAAFNAEEILDEVPAPERGCGTGARHLAADGRRYRAAGVAPEIRPQGIGGPAVEYRDLYKGHTINAWTSEERKGRWTWSFTIDDEAIVSNSGMPRTSEQPMLDEAIARAKAVIDAYPV